jgi:acetyl-CoA acetyltransferase
MIKAVIVEAVRTPIGRHGGVLKDVRSDDLAALLLSEIVKRAGLN